MKTFILLGVLSVLITDGLCNEYCSLSADHVMCAKPPVGPDCVKFTEIIPDMEKIKAILKWHNDERQKVALGQETRGNPGPQPSAGNMVIMEWDDELAIIAQRNANQCLFKHDCEKCSRVLGGRFSVGQNIAMQMSSVPFTTFDFVEAIKDWVDKEVSTLNPSLVNSYQTNGWGHYSQVVWWNTRSIGCGGSTFLAGGQYNFYVVCDYGTAANLPASKMYEVGTACTKCPQETTCDTTFNGLCAITKSPHNVKDKYPFDQTYLGSFPEGTYFPV